MRGSSGRGRRVKVATFLIVVAVIAFVIAAPAEAAVAARELGAALAHAGRSLGIFGRELVSAAAVVGIATARQLGAVDGRLLDVRYVDERVLAAVLRDHDCSAGTCPACGHVTTRRRPVCRSVALARGMRVGRAPSWADEPDAERDDDGRGEQSALFGGGA